MLPHISGKIIPTRRIEHTFPKKRKVETWAELSGFELPDLLPAAPDG
jgi:hypothetical protein